MLIVGSLKRLGDEVLNAKLRNPWIVAVLLVGLVGATIPAYSAPAKKADFLSACLPCHGLDGIGRDVEIPNLAGQNEAYLLNQLRAFHQGRRPHKEMLYISRKMTDEDMRALAAYYASLPPR
jgi:cytochrome c553